MKKILIGLISVIIIAAAVLGFIFFGGNGYGKNEEFATGNTPGNLNNRGLFCEHKGTVFFSNPYDGGGLYSMDVNEENVKKISNVSMQSINADDNHIYYTLSTNTNGSGLGYIRKAAGMFSCKHNGGSGKSYTQDAVGILALCGNDIYFQHYRSPEGTDLRKMSTKKSEPVTVAPNMASPASIDSGLIYYSGDDADRYLYVLDTRTDRSSLLYAHQMYNPIYSGGYVYYIDLESNYHLRKYSPSTGEDIEIVPNRVDTFNIYNSMIYYQLDSSSPDSALRRVSIDGTGDELVMAGIYSDINITSQYVYFHPFGMESPLYHQAVYGAVNPGIFQPETKK